MLLWQSRNIHNKIIRISTRNCQLKHLLMSQLTGQLQIFRFWQFRSWRRLCIEDSRFVEMHPTQEKKPVVNFINILRTAFTHKDPKSAKKTVKLSVFFALSWSAHIRAACITLIKLTHGGFGFFANDLTNFESIFYFESVQKLPKK